MRARLEVESSVHVHHYTTALIRFFYVEGVREQRTVGNVLSELDVIRA